MANIITTPKGKAVYPRIDTPDTKFNEDGLYSCKLHVTEDDFRAFEMGIDKLYDAAFDAECKAQGKKLKKSANKPVRITPDGDFEIYAKQVAQKQTKTKGLIEFSVACFDSQGNKISTPRVGSGSELKLAVEPNFWFIPSQGFGYTLRLKAVQVIDLVEYGGGGNSESYGFGKSDGGYTSESFNETFTETDEAITTEAPF